jgi:hypothetical protein
VRPNKRIDTHLSTPLFDLPLGAIASGAPPTSLAERNLLRHLTWSLPSGQSIAKELHVPVLHRSQLQELSTIAPQFVGSTPLWFYVLKEAEVMAQGAHLGPVGSRLVAEVSSRRAVYCLNGDSIRARRYSKRCPTAVEHPVLYSVPSDL